LADQNLAKFKQGFSQGVAEQHGLQ
jgi:hypothetical protein